MPVIDTPSIWDYIAQAGGAGINSYKEAQDKVRADAAQNAGLLTQLFGAGAIDSGTLAPAISKIPGMGGVKIQPNAAEKQRTPGTPEQLAYAAQGAEAKQKLQKADILTKWSSGQPVTEQEALIAGVPTLEDIKLARSAKVDPTLDQAGKQYVDAEFLKKGGRINPHDAIDIAARAYQQYVKDYQDAGLGTLKPAELQNAQRYFTSRAMDRLNEQRRLDIEATAANNRGERTGIQPADRMFAQLTQLLENNRKTTDDFLKANPGIDVIASKYDGNEAAIPPAFKGQVARYRRLQSRESDLQNAQSQVSMGVIPRNIANMLGSDAALTGGSNEPSVNTGKVAQGIQLIKSKKAKLSDLPQQVKLGRLTQAESDAIQAGVLNAAR